MLHRPQFFCRKKPEKNGSKPTHTLTYQAILESYPKYEKSYQMVTF